MSWYVWEVQIDLSLALVVVRSELVKSCSVEMTMLRTSIRDPLRESVTFSLLTQNCSQEIQMDVRGQYRVIGSLAPQVITALWDKTK